MILNWDNRNWDWNPIDQSLLRVNDWTMDFNAARPFIEKKRTSIQAGGAMGMWPWLMSKTFEKVYTFEASPANYQYLKKNVEGVSNIESYNKALGNEDGKCTIKLHEKEINNAGCYYTVNDVEGEVDLIQLDTFFPNIDDVDFIQLDVEGNELRALQGAEKIIERCSPVIMLENKMLPHSSEIGHKPNDAVKYLTNMGYQVVANVHRDVILKR
jgi:FkbM family methyltransferase